MFDEHTHTISPGLLNRAGEVQRVHCLAGDGVRCGSRRGYEPLAGGIGVEAHARHVLHGTVVQLPPGVAYFFHLGAVRRHVVAQGQRTGLTQALHHTGAGGGFATNHAVL